MGKESITKTIWQYSEALPPETMSFLNGIAADYNKVKNYIYGRYSGIKSFTKLTPGYDILNEMRYSGLRQQLNLPVVYYELAILDAIKDIKTMWSELRNTICKHVNAHAGFTNDEKSYLRIVLKHDSMFAAIINNGEHEAPKKAAGLTDMRRLDNYLRRQVRKYRITPTCGDCRSFKISPNGYSYTDGGIRLVSRVERKRIFIPLRDSNRYRRQLTITITEDGIAIAVPVDVDVIKHADYAGTIFVHIGYQDMFTLSDGTVYGEGLGRLVTAETDRLTEKNIERYKHYRVYEESISAGDTAKSEKLINNNMGRQKYNNIKKRKRSETEAFINHGINKMLENEKPARIVIAAKASRRRGRSFATAAATNRLLSRSFYRYIRRRLEYKCRLNSVELVEVNTTGMGSICSTCGLPGERNHTSFRCEGCGLSISTAFNSAKNIEKKYNNG